MLKVLYIFATFAKLLIWHGEALSMITRTQCDKNPEAQSHHSREKAHFSGAFLPKEKREPF
jgi:hypothetical protein